jgi:hypothetical protein
MKISRQDWERVIEKACDIANATENEGDPMFGVHLEGMMTLLDELEAKTDVTYEEQMYNTYRFCTTRVRMRSQQQ